MQSFSGLLKYRNRSKRSTLFLFPSYLYLYLYPPKQNLRQQPKSEVEKISSDILKWWWINVFSTMVQVVLMTYFIVMLLTKPGYMRRAKVLWIHKVTDKAKVYFTYYSPIDSNSIYLFLKTHTCILQV